METTSNTVREAAAMMNVSTASIYKMRRLMGIAEARGFGDEFYNRVMAGEKVSRLVNELMPDIAERPRHKQAITQFRSAVEKLMQTYGHSVEELTDYILEHENIYKHEDRS